MPSAREHLISLLKELAPEVAEQLEGTEHKVRVEGAVMVVYRVGAVFG